MKRIKTTYEIVTPESAEQGDASERGWEDEEGYDCDWQDEKSAVDLAVEFIQSQMGEGGIEASTSGTMSEHDWWTAYKVDADYTTDEEKSRGFHPVGFSVEEINEINRRLKQ